MNSSCSGMKILKSVKPTRKKGAQFRAERVLGREEANLTKSWAPGGTRLLGNVNVVFDLGDAWRRPRGTLSLLLLGP